MKTQWEAPKDLNTWSLADLIAVRSVLQMMHRYEEVTVVTKELSRRGFDA